MAEKVRMAMIGCGNIAGQHREALQMLSIAGYRPFEVVAVCDVVRSKAESMAVEIAGFQGRRPEVRDSVESLLATGPDFDAADICTIHSEHHTACIPCLEADRHVTIEKPLGITLRAGRVMLDAAEKAGKILQVADDYRFSPENRAIRWAIVEGLIGNPRMSYHIDAAERSRYRGWREHKSQAGAGDTFDWGVHYCDLIRHLLGSVQAVSASVRAFEPFRYEEGRTDAIPVDVEDTTVATLDFESGALGLWVSTSAARGEGIFRQGVYGEKGSICWERGLKTGDREMTMQELMSAHQESISEDERERLFPLGLKDTYAIELHQFIEAVRGNAEVEIGGCEGYRAQAVSLAIFESDALGRKVSLSEVENLEVETYQSEINSMLGIA